MLGLLLVEVQLPLQLGNFATIQAPENVPAAQSHMQKKKRGSR
jgi:hypothetical protein